MKSSVSTILLLSIFLTVQSCAPFGIKPDKFHKTKIEKSSQWKDGHFVNPQPLRNDTIGALISAFSASPFATPENPIPTMAGNADRFNTLPKSGLRVTWFGHSTALIEIDGNKILTDPVWSNRPSPISWIGPKRYYAPLIALSDFPVPDAVIISHDHYDHLDYPTLEAMKNWNTKFIVPLGIGANLAYWGIPADHIIELDWWEDFNIKNLKIVSTPARHASGRYLLDNDKKLWSGYAIVGQKHRVYFSGDTGLFPAMRDIGERFGPFDLTMIEVGQYHSTWPDWHIGPEQATLAHNLVKGKNFLPIHWGLFTLAFHSWTEPVERALVAAQASKTNILLPKPGESIEPTQENKFVKWWPPTPWETAEKHPIISSQMNLP